RFIFEPGEATAKLGPLATRVFGTGGLFDKVGGTQSIPDPMVRPFKPVFHPNGAIIVPNHPYDSGFPTLAAPFRFASVYLQPLVEPLPQFIFDDFTGYPDNDNYLDPQSGNVMLADRNWARVLVYKDPLAVVQAPSCGAYRDSVVGKTPAAYWRLNESGGVQAADETGTYPGTYAGGP